MIKVSDSTRRNRCTHQAMWTSPTSPITQAACTSFELLKRSSYLQAKIIDWDKSVSERIKLAVNDWNANKPVQGHLTPADALDQLSIFQTNVNKLQEDH